MRVGLNPFKDQVSQENMFNHQIIIPVFIPTQEGYFQDSFKIFKSCINSLLATINNNTFISIVNNGSCLEVVNYLDLLKENNEVHEIIHTHNIGKLNAINKALVGHNIPIITISDCDVYFKPGWQEETNNLFLNFPKAGMVGLVPQFNMFSSFCTNTIFDNLLNKKMKFYPVKDSLGMWSFYKSLSWNMPKDHYYFKSILGIEKNGTKACIGSGHFVATYRADLFLNINKYNVYKMGGDSERSLDEIPSRKGYWKLTTFENYAYHMGTVWEDWMNVEKVDSLSENMNKESSVPFNPHKQSRISNFIKNRIFKRLLLIPVMNKFFLKIMGLSEAEREQYKRISF